LERSNERKLNLSYRYRDFFLSYLRKSKNLAWRDEGRAHSVVGVGYNGQQNM